MPDQIKGNPPGRLQDRLAAVGKQGPARKGPPHPDEVFPPTSTQPSSAARVIHADPILLEALANYGVESANDQEQARAVKVLRNRRIRGGLRGTLSSSLSAMAFLLAAAGGGLYLYQKDNPVNQHIVKTFEDCAQSKGVRQKVMCLKSYLKTREICGTFRRTVWPSSCGDYKPPAATCKWWMKPRALYKKSCPAVTPSQ